MTSTSSSIDSIQPIESQNPLLHGYTFYTLKRWPYAELYLEAAVNDEPLLRDYALDLLAQVKSAQGFDLEAAETWEILIKEEPHSSLLPQAHLNQAESYLKAQSYRKAYHAFQALHPFIKRKHFSKIEKSALRAQILFGEAQALEGMGNSSLAKRRYREIMLSHCESEALYPARKSLEHFGKTLSADLFSYDSLRNFFPEHDVRKLARCFLKNERAEIALPLFQVLDGKNSMLAGQSLYTMRRFEEALHVFESNLEPDRPNKEFLFWAAESASRLDQRKKAKDYYELFLKKFPHDSRNEKCHFHLAFTLYLNREFVQAAETFAHYAKRHRRNKKYFDALWFSGWCYYRAHHFSKAIETWQAMLRLKKTLIPHPEQLLYWIGRAFESHDRESATDSYQKILLEWPYSFYASLASDRLTTLGQTRKIISLVPLTRFPDAQDPQILLSTALEAKKHPPLAMKKAAKLAQLGFSNWASDELYRLQSTTRSHRKLLELALLFRSLDDFHHSSYIARVFFEDVLVKPFNLNQSDEAITRDLMIWSLAYPRAYRSLVEQNAQFNQLDPALIWAVMRQESNFRPHAVSKANAYGLMQLIPQTASKMAGKAVTTSELFEPTQNIAWGAKYLRTLMNDFQEHLEWVAPSYNAGPEQTVSWLKERADLAPDEFIEEIPFRETRNFVKRVLRITSIYKMLYEPEPPREIK